MLQSQITPANNESEPENPKSSQITDGFEGVSEGREREGREEVGGGRRGGWRGRGGGEVREGVEHMDHEEG